MKCAAQRNSHISTPPPLSAAPRLQYFKALCGTPYYVAPEVLTRKYTEHSDMWSIGVVMFVMLFGYPPFYADPEQHGAGTDDKIFELVSKGFDATVKDGYGAHFPAAIPISDAARDLISKLLDLDTARRPTATEALSHPWLTGAAASSAPMLPAVLSSLGGFIGKGKFKSAVLGMMTDVMSEDELSELMKTFESIDKDGDGTITVEELSLAVAENGDSANVQEIQRMMQSADMDGDGKLSYREMMLTAVHKKLMNKEERLWAAFAKLDLDGNGKVTAAEIKSVLGENSEAAQLIAEADKDGDGEIDYDEFIAMWTEKGIQKGQSSSSI
jgi:calcium-dependent protein kinase